MQMNLLCKKKRGVVEAKVGIALGLTEMINPEEDRNLEEETLDVSIATK